jgi:3D (Asp-Asp-Asp) domain-containing protein
MNKFTRIMIIATSVLVGYIIGGIVFIEKDTNTIESVEIEYEDHIIEHNVEYLVTATVYHAVSSQCDGDYLTTASGKKIKSTNEAYSHRYIAVSRDLRELFPYGCKVEIIGTGKYDGIYTVADTMNKRYTEYIDILINPGMPIGKWENVVIKKLN